MRYEVTIKMTEIYRNTFEASSPEEAKSMMAGLVDDDFAHRETELVLTDFSIEYEARPLPPTLRELSKAIRQSGQGNFEVG